MAANTLSFATNPNALSQAPVRSIVQKLQYLLTTFLLKTGGLAIKTGGSALAKFANTLYYFVGGNLYKKTTADCAALSGTVTNAKFNVFVFYIDAAGTLTTSMGTEGATLADVVFPAYDPSTKCMIGFVIINPTGTGNFVGGTTPLDDATVVPNAFYMDTPYPLDPVNMLSL